MRPCLFFVLVELCAFSFAFFRVKRALCFLLCLFFVSHAINDTCRVQLRDYHRDLSHALHWPHWQLADNAHANSDEASQSVVRTQPEALKKKFHCA